MPRLRLALKRLVCRLGFGSFLIEFCRECGRETPLVWRAPDALWLATTGETEGVRCPECFDVACYRNGQILRWVPEIAHSKDANGNWVFAHREAT